MAKQQAGLLSEVALFQLGCNPSTLSSHLPEANVKKQNPSDQDQMKHVEAFASSDETAAAKAWKVLERYDRHSLIRELTRLYGAAAAVDHHRVLAGRANPSDGKEDLAATAKRFLTSWLLRRNEDEALRFVSTHPILGSCMIPESLAGKSLLSRGEIFDVFRKVLFGELLHWWPDIVTATKQLRSDGCLFLRHSFSRL